MKPSLVCLAMLFACKASDPPATEPKPKPTHTEPDVPTVAGAELAEIAGDGLPDADLTKPRVVIGTAAITAGPISVPLVEGSVPAAEIDGGERGMLVTKLSVIPAKPTAIAIDRRTSYRTLVRVIYSLSRGDAAPKSFSLLARAGTRTVAIELALPKRSPPIGDDVSPRRPGADLNKQIQDVRDSGKEVKVGGGGGKGMRGTGIATAGKVEAPKNDPPKNDPPKNDPSKKDTTEEDAQHYADMLTVEPKEAETPTKLTPVEPAPAQQPLGLVVSVASDKVLVWSISGLEGTLVNPKLTTPRDATAPAKIAEALDEILKRRAAATDVVVNDLVFMADGKIAFGDFAAILAVARIRIPAILLSTGFE